MKKLIMLMTAMFLCMSSFAQTKGDMYIAGSLFMNSGTQSTILSYDGSNPISDSQPSGLSSGLGAEYSYFATDNLRLSLAISAPFTSTPIEKEDDKWLKHTSTSLIINPNVAYYIRLADKFYYTPEVGFDYSFGFSKQEVSSSDSYKEKYRGWSAYIKILALEFRVTDRIAIGFNAGSINYGSTKFTLNHSKGYMVYNMFDFGLNNADLDIKFYF